MSKHHFVVYWNKDGEYIKNGHKREGFETYAEAFNWALRQVMYGYNYGVYQETKPCPKPQTPKSSSYRYPTMRLSIHTQLLWQHKKN